MALGNPIQLRLSLEKHLAYEQEAKREGKALATYIRERLETGDRLENKLSTLQTTIEDSLGALHREFAQASRLFEALDTTSASQGAAPTECRSTIELLLLLRAIASPDRQMMVHAELRRLGFEPWAYNAETV